MLAADVNSAPELRVDVGCSETQLRTVIATLTWRVDHQAATEQRIDVTAFRDGFERDQFATVPVERGGKFAPAPGLLKMDRDPGRPFDLVAKPRPDNRKGLMTVEVTNLEPRVLYRWRVVTRTDKGWVPSLAVSVESPVCVADEKEGR